MITASIKEGDPEYDDYCQVYATGSVEELQNSKPLTIYLPLNAEQVSEVIKAVGDVKICVRSGGHQYCGSSSVGKTEKFVVIDLRDMKSDPILADEGEGIPVVAIEPGLSLFRLTTWLVSNKFFVPHGMCPNVRIGGHVQTGGYGMLTRSFGLFSDRVSKLQVVLANGAIQTIKRPIGRRLDQLTTDMEKLFFAILGGGPGSFCVVTKIYVNVLRDRDYVMRISRKLIHYSAERCSELMKLCVELQTQQTDCSSVDLFVTVMGKLDKHDGLYEVLFRKYPQYYEDSTLWKDKVTQKIMPNFIIVFLSEVVPTGSNFQHDWIFDKLQSIVSWASFLPQVFTSILGITAERQMEDVSKSMKGWVFPYAREFQMAYIKRAYLIPTKFLVNNRNVLEEVNAIMADAMINEGLRVVSQIMPFGGLGTGIKTGSFNSFSFRDDFIAVVDIFHEDASLNAAQAAVNALDSWYKKLVGEDGVHKVFWGSYSENNQLEDLRDATTQRQYYESEKWLDTLVHTKNTFDPNELFSANNFIVPNSKPSKWEEEERGGSSSKRMRVTRELMSSTSAMEEESPLMGDARVNLAFRASRKFKETRVFNTW